VKGTDEGIHVNSVSSNHPPDTITLTKSMEIKSMNEGGEGDQAQQTYVSAHEANCTTSHS